MKKWNLEYQVEISKLQLEKKLFTNARISEMYNKVVEVNEFY